MARPRPGARESSYEPVSASAELIENVHVMVLHKQMSFCRLIENFLLTTFSGHGQGRLKGCHRRCTAKHLMLRIGKHCII